MRKRSYIINFYSLNRNFCQNLECNKVCIILNSILLLVIVKKNYKFDSRAYYYYLFLKEKIEKGKNGRQNGSR